MSAEALVAAWALRLGVALPAPAHVQPAPDGTGLALVDRGVALALVDATGPDAARALLDDQLAPFRQAGLESAPVETVACRLAGRPGQCLATTLTVAPGAVLSLLVGSTGDWAAACLDRGGDAARRCAPVIAPAGAP